VVAGKSGRRLIWPRSVAAYFGPTEERLVPSGSARGFDAAIAALATIAGVVAAVERFRTLNGWAISVVPGALRLDVPVGPSPPTSLTFWMLMGVVLTTAPLAFRRTYPITAFCVILAAIIATSGSTHTAITFAAVIFAAYCAVAYSPYRRLAVLAVLVAAITVTAAYPNTSPPVPERFGALLVLLPTVAVGIAIRVWRRRARESAQLLRRAEQEHEAETRRAVELERARIASEMHDVVTHNVSVMVVQAGAARRVLDTSPGGSEEARLAREALLAVEASGRTAMTELRHLLGLLAPSGEPGAPSGASVGLSSALAAAGGRNGAGEATLRPQPDVAQIPALLARVCAAGLPVELSIAAPDRTRRALPPGVDLAAYRVVQEALTNVIRHAGQARTVVDIEYRPRELQITVSDDGRPTDAPTGGLAVGPPPGPGGRGLIGLRERIAIYGGKLDAGPRPGGGWRVRATIPLEPLAGGPGEDVLIRTDVPVVPA
jgi:signal transduction histidine kinase